MVSGQGPTRRNWKGNTVAKVGQQVLLSEHHKHTILALTVVRKESQAEVLRRAIDIALPQLMQHHDEDVTELTAALQRMKVDAGEALEDMTSVKLRADGVRRKLTINDLKTADGQWRARYVFGEDRPAKPRALRALPVEA